MTALPVVIDTLISTEKHYTFIWSLLLIPNIIVIVIYPNWKVIISSVLFFTLLKFSVEITQILVLTNGEMLSLITSSIVNWSVLFTVASFRMKYNKLLEEVKLLTLIDPLTGLYNRRYFESYIKQALSSSKTDLVLIMLDVDRFKQFNDTYGHLCGDLALKHLSKVVKKSIRTSDILVRMGGEEFAILIPKTLVRECFDIAQKVRKNVEDSNFIYKGKSIPITISLGIAEYNGKTIPEFIECADNALYEAKENGRNQVVIYKS